MMTKAISYATLEQILLSLGFVRQVTAGSQVVFQQTETDTLLVLPAGAANDTVDTTHLKVVRRMLVEKGVVANPDAFDALTDTYLQHAS